MNDTVPMCPECRVGKHANCPDFAYDANDKKVRCACIHAPSATNRQIGSLPEDIAPDLVALRRVPLGTFARGANDLVVEIGSGGVYVVNEPDEYAINHSELTADFFPARLYRASHSAGKAVPNAQAGALADLIDRVADRRAEYITDSLRPDDRAHLETEVQALRNAAKIARGDVHVIRGLLPTWRWDEFGAELTPEEKKAWDGR